MPAGVKRPGGQVPPLVALAFLAAGFPLLLGCAVAAWEGPQPGRVTRVGFLSITVPGAEASAPTVQAFREALRRHGYVEGRNVSFEYRFSEGNEDRLPDLAAELVRLPVDVIVAVGPPWAKAAQGASSTTPVVMVMVGDPIGAALVASLARPGGNVTGVATMSPRTIGKRVELLKELLPAQSRVGVLANLANSSAPVEWGEAQAAARALGLEPELFDVREPREFEAAFKAAAAGPPASMVVVTDPLTLRHRELITRVAAQYRLPAAYTLTEFVEAGGLISYGVDRLESFRRAAAYVARILGGARPADLPVEQPTEFQLAVNLRTAEALGLTIPPSILRRASRVIQSIEPDPIAHATGSQ